MGRKKEARPLLQPVLCRLLLICALLGFSSFFLGLCARRSLRHDIVHAPTPPPSPPALALDAAGIDSTASVAEQILQEQQLQQQQQQFLHVATATDEAEPFGLIALINSTLVHASADSRALLRFHVIVPPLARRRLRLLLETLFQGVTLRMYTLDTGGARAKIVRHLRRHEQEEVRVSPYRYAHAYLPSLLPSHVRRVLWLHTDVLVLADVRELVLDVDLDGAPAAAVEDCSRPALIQRVNASHPLLGGAVAPGACGFDPGVLLVDLAQWSYLEMTARVEYWQGLNLKARPFFAHDDAHAALLLALLPVYARLPPAWAIGALSERRPANPSEVERARALLLGAMGPSAAASVGVGGSNSRRTVVLGADAGSSSNDGNSASRSRVSAARALHFSGRWKPWLRNPRTSGVQCLPAAEDVADGFVSGQMVPCADLWSPYARHAARTLQWRAPTAIEAAHAESVATAAAVGGHEEEIPDTFSIGTPALAPDALLSDVERAPIHVTVACGDHAPFGLVALINSTLVHASAQTREALRFHVVTRPELQSSLSRKLKAVFMDQDVSIAVVTPPPERLAKLAGRLEALDVSADAFEMPPLWLHNALPGVPRTLLLSPDTLVLVDVRELYAADLQGRACAVIEDCSVLFELVYNYHHPFFSTKHARSSCSFDSGTMVVDLKAWRKEDVPTRLLDVLGTQRRTEGLYAQPNGASTLAAPLMLALDKRALKLPSGWLARGLAREALTRDELRFWQRLYGQDGVNIPFELQPVRAVHVANAPSRDAGDALLVRFSGGPYLPWLRRCSRSTAARAPRCGRGLQDCALLWRPYFAMSLIPLLQDETLEEEEAAQLAPKFACVKNAEATVAKAGVEDADAAFPPAEVRATNSIPAVKSTKASTQAKKTPAKKKNKAAV